MLNFKQWLEDTGAVSTQLGDTEQQGFSRMVRSKYTASSTPSPDDDGESGEEIDNRFLGRRASKYVYRRGKKYMNKSKMRSK